MSKCASAPIMIQIDKASFGYASDLLPAIDDLTIAFQSGDLVAVIGPNGAGKSTLFKTIVGLIPPLRGSVLVHGAKCGSHKDCVSYIPQKETIDWNYPITVRDVVMMGRFGKIPFFRSPSALDHDAVTQAMTRMDILPLANRKIRDCSGGQQQRVFLARSLAQEPHILLMDEPFNGVDFATEAIILENLRTFQARHVTTLVATHDLNLVAEHFKKVFLLNKRMIAFGSVDDVMTPEYLQQAYGKKTIYY